MSWPLVRLAPALALLAACTASSESVQPAADQFYFPNGMVLSPDESFLFVSNANADLRYDSGTMAVVDLDAVDAIAQPWIDDGQAAGGCAPHAALRHILVCNEADVLLGDATVRLGNFAGAVRLQELADGRLRLFTPVRGDPSLTWIDFDPEARALACGGEGSHPLCDDAHRLIRLNNDLDQPGLSDEPFGLFVDGEQEYAVLTHLTAGFPDYIHVTLATAPLDGSPPVLVDEKGGFFGGTATGAIGAVGVAGRRPGTPDDLLYVTSRTDSRVQTLYVARPSAGKLVLAPSDYFFLNSRSPFVTAATAPYDDSRDLAFNADGSRAYVINRKPPTLVEVDTSLDRDGRPANTVLGSVELCSQPAQVTLADLGRGDRAFVSCFRSGQVWVLDPVGKALEAVIDVGRGPNAVIVSPGRRRLYVSNFLEDSVAVIDLTPGAPTEDQVVLRLGTSRQEGKD